MRRSRPYVSVAFGLMLASCGSFTPIGEGDGEAGGPGEGATGGTSNAGSGGAGGTAGKGGKGGASGTGATGGSGNAGSDASGGSANASATGGSGNTSASGGSANAGATGGSANAGSGGSGGVTCEIAMDCPVLGLPCDPCPDGSLACPVTECVNGQCSTSFPTCISACEADADCPVGLASCTLCADGSTVCPWARCDDGACISGIDACGSSDPCANKACGDTCQLCDGGDCVNRPGVLAYCNAELECQFNEPVCEGKECSVAEDCPESEACSLCPDGETCATRECVNGACQFQCVPEACRDCSAPNTCIYQVGGPGPSHYACAEQNVCESPWPCACILNQGECQPEMVNGYCRCDNGLE